MPSCGLEGFWPLSAFPPSWFTTPSSNTEVQSSHFHSLPSVFMQLPGDFSYGRFPFSWLFPLQLFPWPYSSFRSLWWHHFSRKLSLIHKSGLAAPHHSPFQTVLTLLFICLSSPTTIMSLKAGTCASGSRHYSHVPAWGLAYSINICSINIE